MSEIVASPQEKARPNKGGRALILDEFAPYRIAVLGHLISERLARAYGNENLTIPEWRVLAVISQADAVAARDVVAKTPMDKMTVSRAVSNLEAKDLVVRQTDARDRRVYSLSLSPAGRAVYERVAAQALAFEDDLLQALSDDERKAFQTMLLKLEAHVSAD